MVQSSARNVKSYLDDLPAERRRELEQVRRVILQNIPKGYEEGMQWGMISYFVPLSLYPKGYGGNPKVALPYLGLAAQKNYMALYMMGTYGNKDFDAWFRKEYKAAGKKLDMGKGCVRFKRLDDLPLSLIGKAVKKVSVKSFIEQYEKARTKLKKNS